MNDRVLVCIPNILLASHIRVALRATGFQVESATPEEVCGRLGEDWRLVVADLSAIGPAACEDFPPLPEETRGLGIITHRDVILRPKWEAVGFEVVFRGDFFSEPERYLF